MILFEKEIANKNELNEPLVSVAVISYNSAETIIETLVSIKNQTYNNIELIISDDCSSDSTKDLVLSWINDNCERFVRSVFIEEEHNTGVTKNCNRAYKAAKGIFIKDIAADDVLLPNYVQDCIDFLQVNPNVNVLYTKARDFIKVDGDLSSSKQDYSFFDLKTVDEQKNYLINHGVPRVPTPTVIYRLSTIQKLGYFDERIPMWEDGPMTFKLIDSGEVLHLLDKIDVLIRVRDNSLSHSLSVSHMKSQALFFKYYETKYKDKKSKLRFELRRIKMFFYYHSNVTICKKIVTLLEK